MLKQQRNKGDAAAVRVHAKNNKKKKWIQGSLDVGLLGTEKSVEREENRTRTGRRARLGCSRGRGRGETRVLNIILSTR